MGVAEGILRASNIKVVSYFVHYSYLSIICPYGYRNEPVDLDEGWVKSCSNEPGMKNIVVILRPSLCLPP